uniref:DNA-directed RNA polymerase III subunit RPC7 n=1 Tax=Parastrongyloides trichosuri TaxID=131310 RepID=A0A0N4ZX07_PARTI
MVDSTNDLLIRAQQLRKKVKQDKVIADDKYPLSQKLFFQADDKRIKSEAKKKGPPHPYYSITYRDAVLEAPPGCKIRQNNKNGGQLFDYRGFPFWHPKFDFKLLEKTNIETIDAERKQKELDKSDSSETDPNMVIKPEDKDDYMTGKLHYIDMPPHESLNLHPWGPLSLIEAKTKYFTSDIIRSNSIKGTIVEEKSIQQKSKLKDPYFKSSLPNLTFGPIPSQITIYSRTKPKDQLTVKYNLKDYNRRKTPVQEEESEGED